MTSTETQQAPAPTLAAAGAAPESWNGVIYLGQWASFIRRHRRAVTLLVVAMSVGTCAVLCTFAGWPAISARRGYLSGWWIALMLAAHVAAYAGYLIAHHGVVNQSRTYPMGWRLAAQVGFIGFGGWLLSGGFNVDRHALQSSGLSRDDANQSALALGLLELLVLTPAAWVCAVLLLGTHLSPGVTVPWVVLVPAGFILAIVVAIVREPSGGEPEGRRVAWALDLLSGGVRTAVRLLKDPRRGPMILAGITLYWAMDIVALWAALRFVSSSLSLGDLILAYATGYILTRRTLPFAGAVVIEVMLALGLISLGVPLASAALAVLVYRLSDFGLTLGAALLASNALENTVTIVPVETPVTLHRHAA